MNECKLWQISHSTFLYSARIGPYSVNLATFRKASTAPITTCNSLQSTSVATEQSFYFEYANVIIHLPINPLGLIVKRKKNRRFLNRDGVYVVFHLTTVCRIPSPFVVKDKGTNFAKFESSPRFAIVFDFNDFIQKA